MWNKFNIYSINGTSKFIINNNNNNKENNANSRKDSNLSLKLYDRKNISKPIFCSGSQFNEIFVEDLAEEKNDLMPERNFFILLIFFLENLKWL